MSENKYGVVAIGNAIVDVLSQSTDEFLSDNALNKGHMTLIEEEESNTLYSKMGPGVEVSGGSAANTVAAMAALGDSTAFIGKVSNDQLGEVFSHDMRAIGVNYETTPLDDGPSTARCLILVTPDAERTMSTYLGSSVWISPSDVDETIISQSEITYLEGYLFDRNNAKKAFKTAAEMAHKAGKKVALSLSDAFCVERHRLEFLELVRNHIDILFANEAEIISLFEAKDFDEALYEVKDCCEIAALTRGENGSVIIANGEAHYIDAEKIDTVVDTTGAGDLYAAGFFHGYLKGYDYQKVGQIASITSGAVLSHMGARPQINLTALIDKKLAA